MTTNFEIEKYIIKQNKKTKKNKYYFNKLTIGNSQKTERQREGESIATKQNQKKSKLESHQQLVM